MAPLLGVSRRPASLPRVQESSGSVSRGNGAEVTVRVQESDLVTRRCCYLSVASTSWTSQALKLTTRCSQHIVDTRVRRAMTSPVSQDLWAPNGSMRRSFNIVKRRSVSKIARLKRYGATIFGSGIVAEYGWVAILAGFEPLSHDGSTPCPRLPCGMKTREPFGYRHHGFV